MVVLQNLFSSKHYCIPHDFYCYLLYTNFKKTTENKLKHTDYKSFIRIEREKTKHPIKTKTDMLYGNSDYILSLYTENPLHKENKKH